MNIFIDIETIPCQRTDLQEALKKSITAPAQYKKPESIAQWLDENREAAYDEAWRKTALDGAYGQVLCVGLAAGGDTPYVAEFSIDCKDPAYEKLVLSDMNEWLSLLVSSTYMTCFVGHNISAFDLRFLYQRCIVNKVCPHPSLTRAIQAKPWESDKVFDTMVQWAGFGGRVSLDKLCNALNIQSPKGDLDGIKVWDYVRDDRVKEVISYCEADVVAVREVWKRMTLAKSS